MKLKYIALLFLLITNTVFADETFICRHGKQERIIEVAYLTEASVPCEVRYSKNEETQVLWNAANEEGYCEKQARAFVEKQEGWGWQCTLSEKESDES